MKIGEDDVRFIKSRWFSQLGHVKIMRKKMIHLRILDGKMHGVQKHGRSRERWTQNVEKDIKNMYQMVSESVGQKRMEANCE